MIVINLFGGPGSGKSTTASGLFNLMKLRGHKVELITEYAKELTYEQDWFTLSNQFRVSTEQYKRQDRLDGQVDYCITDSPLLLGMLYNQNQNKTLLEEMIGRYWTQFDNKNFFLKRVKPYAQYGRKHTEEEAKLVDDSILDMLKFDEIDYKKVVGDEDAHVIIYNMIFKDYLIVYRGE